MARVKIKELSAGMELDADVIDGNGRFLLGKGCVLTDKHLKALTAWGIMSVEIAGDAPEQRKENFQLPASVMESTVNDLHNRFRLNDVNHPLIKEIFNAILELNLQRQRRKV